MKILISSANEAVRKRWSEALFGKHILSQAATLDALAKMIRNNEHDLLMLHRSMVEPQHLKKICTYPNHPRVFVLADRPDNQDGLFCFSIGCVGYANTYISSGRLQAAISSISQGLVWVGESLMQYILKGLAATEAPLSTTETKKSVNILDTVSPREQEIALLVATGMSNLAISQQLGITERTVKAHLSAIYSKTKTKGRLELALQINKQRKAVQQEE